MSKDGGFASQSRQLMWHTTAHQLFGETMSFVMCKYVAKECTPLNDLPRRNPTPDLSLGFKWTPTEASSLSYLGITSAPAMKVYDREQVRRSGLEIKSGGVGWGGPRAR